MNSPLELAAHLTALQLVPAADAERLLKDWAPNAATAADLLALLESRGALSPFQSERLRREESSGLVVGPYRLVEPLGEGGMGQVFKAFHPFMNRHVALKLIRPERLGSADAVARFQREIQAAAQLEHPNIIRAYDAGSTGGDGHFYLAMELADGRDLARFLKEEGLLPAEMACDFIRQAALGLSHAHERGLIHRDIKPANLLLTKAGVVKVLDLGLARLIHEEELQAPAEEDAALAASLTRSGAVMGTPDFMAPEQAHDSRLTDGRSDIYSLGCTFYQLLAGRVPFDSHRTLHRKLHAHQNYAPDNPIERLRPDLPAGLPVLLRSMMAKKPEHRFATMAKVAEALAPFAPRTNRPRLVPLSPRAPLAEPPGTEVWTPPAVSPPPETVDFNGPPLSTVETPAAPPPAPPAPEPPAPPAKSGYSILKQIKEAQALAEESRAEALSEQGLALAEVMRSQFEAGNVSEALDAADALLLLQPGWAEAVELRRFLRQKYAPLMRRRALNKGVYIFFMGAGIGLMMTLPALGVLWFAFWLDGAWPHWMGWGLAYVLKALAGAWQFGMALTSLGGAIHRRWLADIGGKMAYLREGLSVFGSFAGGAAFCFVTWPGALALLGLSYAVIVLNHFIAPEGLPFETNSLAKKAGQPQG